MQNRLKNLKTELQEISGKLDLIENEGEGWELVKNEKTLLLERKEEVMDSIAVLKSKIEGKEAIEA